GAVRPGSVAGSTIGSGGAGPPTRSVTKKPTESGLNRAGRLWSPARDKPGEPPPGGMSRHPAAPGVWTGPALAGWGGDGPGPLGRRTVWAGPFPPDVGSLRRAGYERDAGPVAEPELSFAGLLRQLRAEANLTQEELAAAAGLSPGSVSGLERGITRAAHKD